MGLAEEVASEIKGHLQAYRRFIESDEGKRWIIEREERRRRYKEMFSAEKIDYLSESDLASVIAELWANQLWTNKQRAVDRVLQNDFDVLRSALKDLIWGSDPLRNRFDKFFKIIRGMGPAQTTEIICMVRPDEYFIWNERSRRALRMLGLGDVLPLNKYKLSGKEYEEVISVAKEIAKIMREEGLGSDLLDVDLLLYFIQSGIEEVAPEPGIEEDYDFDHDEIVEKLVALGEGLGFEAESEVPIATGARVDVVWRAKIGNLGIVNYVFEVHRAGSIDSAILNLMKAKNNPTVQKLIIVSNTRNLKTMEREISALAEEFRKFVSYMEAKDVLEASQPLQRLSEILEKLELVRVS
ncbi:MAG: hypothetical protein QXG30_00855 [Candidatus Korarchaeum sp.]